MNKTTILQEYRDEYKHALKMKEWGQNLIAANIAGTDAPVSIDELIAMWKTGIDAMTAGADPAQFAKLLSTASTSLPGEQEESDLSTLEEYRWELKQAVKMKAAGQTLVAADVAGTANDVTIDEYIAQWTSGIAAMEAGADQEQFAY